MTKLRDVLIEALTEADVKPDAVTWVIESVDDFGIALQSKLHDAGFAIHSNDGRCVRLKQGAEAFGRPMTDAEAVLVEQGRTVRGRDGT